MKRHISAAGSCVCCRRLRLLARRCSDVEVAAAYRAISCVYVLETSLQAQSVIRHVLVQH